MPSLALENRALIDVTGPDAEHLLHNVVTTDIEGLAEGEVHQGALLTPQGKILFDFLVSRSSDGGFVLEIDQSLADDFVRRMTLYKLRAKAEIAPRADAAVIVSWGDDATGLTDMRFREGPAVHRRYDAATAEPAASAEDYDAIRIAAGVAESGRDYPAGDTFPHDVLYDLNGGISFKKGCFVGQEVVSRMQHRGTARRRLVQVTFADRAAESGSAVTAGEREIGTLGTVAGQKALAIVRTDRVADALSSGAEIAAGGFPATLALYPWTGLAFDTSATSDAG